jgi:uncharacterized 2Fe-2S/4Fe-4S cluster protein (DUF4445 family)
MATQPIELRIEPEGRRLSVKPGRSLLAALAAEGLMLPSDCGGKGLCGKCRVRIQAGEHGGQTPPDAAETELLGPNLSGAGYRLACRVTVHTPLTIYWPKESRPGTSERSKGPTLLSASYFRKIKHQRFSDTIGLAVDLGTTTIGLYLCDCEARRVISSTARRNPQGLYGADVMSRISAARTPETRRRLHAMAVKAIESGALALCASAGIHANALKEIVVVGNPAMIHLLLDRDPTSIGLFPFKPLFRNAQTVNAGRLGFTASPSATVYSLPLISGFVGSDIIAAALAANLHQPSVGTMLVDIGTNGEIFLTTDRGYWAASCATGPAFEGAAIHNGMAAGEGAIEAVKIDALRQAVSVTVIQADPRQPVNPLGICGSGVVQAVAEMLRRDILTPDGRFNRDGPFSHRLHAADTGVAFELVSPESSFNGRGIVLTQKDVRAIQLSKGAIRAGIELLCRHTGIHRPHKILLAGAFGNHLSRADALTIGMFPPLGERSVIPIGNAAGSGAILALLDPSYREKAQQMAQATMVLDLVGHPQFQETFIGALAFPSSDPEQ